jgi:fluoride exporter
MKILIYVFLGGGMGSLVRYFFGKFVHNQVATSFPLGTLAINIAASLILGIFVGKYLQNDSLKALIAIGFCGGFSTFSTFSNDTLQLMLSGRIWESFLNVILNVTLCISATYVGILLVK